MRGRCQSGQQAGAEVERDGRARDQRPGDPVGGGVGGECGTGPGDLQVSEPGQAV